MVVVQRLQQLVDLRFGVLPVRLEAACDVLEDHASLTLSHRQAREPAILDEVAQHALLLGRRVRKLAHARWALARRGPERFKRHVQAAENTRRRCSSASRPASVAGVVPGRVEDACAMREACQNR
jgi:hypothetical protein